MPRMLCAREGTIRTAVRLAYGLALSLFLQGCSIVTGSDCAIAGHYGVIATVVDGRTQSALATQAKITLRDGTYTEVISAPNLGPGIYGGAFDRKGVYSLTVEAAGYQTFVQSGVAVQSRACGEINTNSVRVTLVPG